MGLPISIVALGACVGGDPPSPFMERVDSAGIEVLSILEAPADTVRMGRPAIRIGSAEVEAAGPALFQRISDLAVFSDGRLAVIDNRGARVAMFDSDGRWLTDVGRRGEGPGEYMAPLYASVRGDSLFVWDVRQRRLSQFTAEGTFVDALVLAEWAGSRPFAAIGGAFLMEVESGQLMDPAPARGAIVRIDRDGEVADTIVGPYAVPEVGWVVVDPESGYGRMTNPPALSVYPRWDLLANRLYWLDPIGASVQVRDLATGSMPWLIRLPYVTRPPTGPEREAYFRALQVDFDLSDDALADERAATTFAELKGPATAIHVGVGGDIWIAPHDPTATQSDHVGAGWDVFSLNEQLATHVLFPNGFELLALRGSRAYGITTLVTGIRVVDVFDIP